MTSTPALLGLGEFLWDCFPDRRLPGGAPANVAFHAQQLGLKAAIVTRVGCDESGDDLCRLLTSQGLGLDLVQRDPHHATGTVTVELGHDKTTYTFLPNSAWDFLALTPELIAALRSAPAICFGTLAQRSPTSRDTIQACLRIASPSCLTVYDVNLRSPFYAIDWIKNSLHHARIVKLNDDEVRVLSPFFSTDSANDLEFARHLLQHESQLELVCVTRGAGGCLAVSRTEMIDEPGIPVKVVDTVGAGDSFTAALIATRLAGWPLQRSIPFANRVGSLVASHAGAMPILHRQFAELRSEFIDDSVPACESCW